MNLLPRFYDPQEGIIEIDNQNIKNVSLKSLRKNLSMVSQDVILFDDTVKNNISYAREKATFNEIEKACKYAAADDFIKITARLQHNHWRKRYQTFRWSKTKNFNSKSNFKRIIDNFIR